MEPVEPSYLGPGGASPEETAATSAGAAPLELRRVLARFATGVAVVTARANEVDFAMTANSFTSVSLEPPLVLFCVDKTARFHQVVVTAGGWGVSVLHAWQEPVSRWYATRGRPDTDQLARFGWVRGRLGSALLAEAIATLECATIAVHDGGDHTIVVGEVLDATTAPGAATPLVFFESRYSGLPAGQRPPNRPTAGPDRH